MIGILDHDVSQGLQLEPDLTLERAIQIARQSEQIKLQTISLWVEHAVDGMSHTRRQFQTPANKKRIGRENGSTAAPHAHQPPPSLSGCLGPPCGPPADAS
ncbi:uncharacterized protein LOC124871995 isoform X2 [Girardinichthys multiradiatus]|uniref:uncharacterized protein LOC124871995 isoform X2 n=1 Tax=Girardinichthys multiradiatus TaxID=208333 RepID=UPI001FAD7467|nr:uncharacterized protein LOC124871995 isoform X2 [Girardinichthys multiradiatus]